MSNPPYIAVRLQQSGWLDIIISEGNGEFADRRGANFATFHPLDQLDIDRLRELVDTAQRMLDASV